MPMATRNPGDTIAAAHQNAIVDALKGTVGENLTVFAKGADLTSASALVLGTDGNYFDVTGTVTITSISTLPAGTMILLQFDGILTLTHNATSLILIGAANFTTAAGDRCLFVSEGSGNWREVSRSGPAGIVTLTGTQTLTNKTLTAPTVADFTNALHDHGDTDDGGTLAAAALPALPLVIGGVTTKQCVSRTIVNQTVNVNVSTATYVDLTGMTATITTITGDQVCVRIQGNFYKATAGNMAVVVDRSGTKVGGDTTGSSVYASFIAGTPSRSFLKEVWDAPAAGTYTYKGQGWNDDTNAASFGGGQSMQFVCEIWR